MNRPTALAVATLALAAGLPFAAHAQDLADTANGQAKVLLDNDKIRVIELTVAPGDKTGMHSHGDNFVYWLTPSDSVQTMGDGSTKQMHRKTGEIQWSGPVVHDTANTSQATTRVLIVELKEAPAHAHGATK